MRPRPATHPRQFRRRACDKLSQPRAPRRGRHGVRLGQLQPRRSSRASARRRVVAQAHASPACLAGHPSSPVLPSSARIWPLAPSPAVASSDDAPARLRARPRRDAAPGRQFRRLRRGCAPALAHPRRPERRRQKIFSFSPLTRGPFVPRANQAIPYKIPLCGSRAGSIAKRFHHGYQIH